MITRAGSGWQTLLADLSIILFMVTAATLSPTKEATPAKGGAAPETPSPSPRSEPLAVYRAGATAPPLGQWLAAQSPDSRQQLSIVAHYAPGNQQASLAEAGTLLAQAGTAGVSARLVVEPGLGGTVATLGYDAVSIGGGSSLAQGLLQGPANHFALETRP
jgi:hypothetical protein